MKKIILYRSCGDLYQTWFEGMPMVTGQAQNLGTAVWYLIEKSHKLFEVKEYKDPGVLKTNLKFCIDTGKIEAASKYAAELGRKLSKKEISLCEANFQRKQGQILEYWEKFRSGSYW